MTPFEYLKNCVITDIAPSTIHGVGTFALTDIKAGQELFKKWTGESGIYVISKSEFKSLPKYVQVLILKSYENHLNKQHIVWFRLTKGCYWTLANPLAYTNTAEFNGNFSSSNGVAKRDIRAGEELLGTYNLSNTTI